VFEILRFGLVTDDTSRTAVRILTDSTRQYGRLYIPNRKTFLFIGSKLYYTSMGVRSCSLVGRFG
jgi:hypothetical protein